MKRLASLLIMLLIICRPSTADDTKAPGVESSTESSALIGPDDWPLWRGPNSDGIAVGPAVPTHWSDKENVKWKTKIPGRGHSSPIILGDKLFLETADERSETQSVICLDRDDGELLWTTVLHKGKFDKTVHAENTQASSTLATDGEQLYALFLNGSHVWATALNLAGKPAWKKDTGVFSSKFGFSSSPTLYKSLLIMAADHQQGGYVAALKTKTGDIAWKKKRPTKSSYASPRVVTLNGQDQLIIGGCNLLKSFDPLTGKDLWQIKGTAEACVGTPVVADDLVFASGGYPEHQLVAVDGKGKMVWQNKVQSYVPSLLAYEGHIYATPDDGVFSCYDAKTCKEKWKKRVGGNFRVSPLVNNGNIFITDMSGKTTVFRANSAKFEQVAENQLGSEGWSSPAVSKGQLFLRVADSSGGQRQEWVYCLGQ